MILMEWLKKLLEGAQIKDGKLDVESLIASINTEFPKHAVPKVTYNELAETKKKLETDLQGRDTQLEELKKNAGSSEELKKQIEQLQATNTQKETEYQTQLKDLQVSNAIKLAVTGKVHDENLVAGLVDKSKLVIDGDKVVGLDDQLKSIQETKAFLFKPADGGTQAGFKVGNDGKGSGAATNEQLSSIFGNTTK
jgi:hypothetical protein